MFTYQETYTHSLCRLLICQELTSNENKYVCFTYISFHSHEINENHKNKNISYYVVDFLIIVFVYGLRQSPLYQV